MPLGGTTVDLPADLIRKSAGFSMDIGNLEKYFLFNESLNKELLSNDRYYKSHCKAKFYCNSWIDFSRSP